MGRVGFDPAQKQSRMALERAFKRGAGALEITSVTVRVYLQSNLRKGIRQVHFPPMPRLCQCTFHAIPDETSGDTFF